MILKQIAELPARKRIGILALVLAFIAIFLGSPYDKANAKVNLKEISKLTESNISTINVDDLSSWLIAGKMDYRLIDLRPTDSYETYNIPSSENIEVDGLLTSDLMSNEKIILYSDKDKIASQAWFILKAANYRGVYLLDGGIDSWKNKIVFPSCTCNDNPTEDQKNIHAKKIEVAKFFGGQMNSENDNSTTVKKELPKLKAPKQIVLKKSGGKRKREGC